MSAQSQLLEVAMRDLARRHAAHLRDLGPVRVLALDPCPICAGRVVASETVAHCRGCGWSWRDDGVEPVASRRADP